MFGENPRNFLKILSWTVFACFLYINKVVSNKESSEKVFRINKNPRR